ncbi:hypothetical protein D3C72_1611970 [compost metagenome]
MGAAKKVTPRFTMPGACASLSAKFSAFSKSSKVTSVSSHGCAGASAISSSSTRPLVPHRWCMRIASAPRSSITCGSASMVIARMPSTLPGAPSGP